MRDEEDDGSSGGEDGFALGRLAGARLPEDELWSDEEGAGHRVRVAEDAADVRPAGGPWGVQTQRRLGGPRVEEPITAALLRRLLVYALAVSMCLTGAEVLTMWASRRIGWAIQPGLLFGTLWGCTRCACLFGLPFCWLCAYGLLKHPAVWKEMIPPRAKVLDELGTSRIFFRHVVMPDDDRQLAQACLAHTVSLLQRTLPEVTWRVDLVCEGLPFWEPPPAVHIVAVPAEYVPANGTQGRARALHYAALHSTAAAGDWIVYLGAASVLRERTVDAILTHVVDEASRLSTARPPEQRHATQYGRIAQGPVCIGRTGGSWMGFLSDTQRAGLVYGIQRWQYEAGEAWAGVEQSYLVAPKELEVAVGFDHGRHAVGADLTLFALLCRDSGARFTWLDAPTEEAAPQTPGEFMARRRNLYASRLSILAVSGDGIPGALSLDRRVALAVTTVSGVFAQLSLAVTALSVVIRHQISVAELVVSFTISFNSGIMLFCYCFGFAASCSPMSFGGGPVGWCVFLSLLVAQVAWAPVASMLDVYACVQALRTHLQSENRGRTR